MLQALGVPTGSHGAFRDYQVDAITLELSPRFSLNNENNRSAFLLRGGRLVSIYKGISSNHLYMFNSTFYPIGDTYVATKAFAVDVAFFIHDG